jgi:hypothetical protein
MAWAIGFELLRPNSITMHIGLRLSGTPNAQLGAALEVVSISVPGQNYLAGRLIWGAKLSSILEH